MRILLMCEGPNEEAVMNILLDSQALIFNKSDLIGIKPYHIRNLNHPIIRQELKLYGKPVKIYRIGDTQNDSFSIPEELKGIVLKKNIYRFCTKPEIEMLLILNESLEKKFEKVKSTMKAKDFAKQNVIYNGHRYNQSTEFFYEYFGGKNVKKLISSIKRYRSYKKHKKNELFLDDLLKNDKF